MKIIALIALVIVIVVVLLAIFAMVSVKPTVDPSVSSLDIRDDGEIILDSHSNNALRRAKLQNNGALVMYGNTETRSFKATVIYYSNGKRKYKKIEASLSGGEPAVLMLPSNTNEVNIYVTEINGVNLSAPTGLKLPSAKITLSCIIIPVLALVAQVVGFALSLQVLYPSYRTEDWGGWSETVSVYTALTNSFIVMGVSAALVIVSLVVAIVYKKKANR